MRLRNLHRDNFLKRWQVPGSREVPTHAALEVGDEKEAFGLDGLYDKDALQTNALTERGSAIFIETIF